MINLKNEILETNLIWNDNVPDRGEWFEIYVNWGQLEVEHCSRFSIRYEDQNNWHNPTEYWVRSWIISSLIDALKDIPDDKVLVVFYSNYDMNDNGNRDKDITIEKKELIKILKKIQEEASE